MTTLSEAAQQALEALGLWATGRDMDAVALNDLIFRLEAALAEPVQEPVAWMDDSGHPKHIRHLQSVTERRLYGPLRPLYTAPPQRKPLTEEEIADIYIKWDATPGVSMADFARAVERAHGIGGKE